MKLGGDLEGAGAAVGDLHLVAGSAKHDGEGLGSLDVVIRHQDSAGHGFLNRQCTRSVSSRPSGSFVERGQTDHELAASTNAKTVGLHASPVELDQMPHERQPDPQSARRSSGRGIRLHEQVEHPG